jgi:SAM-dependent methyltransferase
MTESGPPSEPQTWHYGVNARWWAEFNVDGPEIAYYQRFIEDDGQPALDVACGTGRLLIPYLRAGLDVDGADVSPDMLALCRERAEREGLSPTLYQQPSHRLDLPRQYRTVIVTGSFGLGGNRDHDVLALRRFFDILEPGGRLALDNEVPYANNWHWRRWLKDERAELPAPWPEEGARKTAADGTEFHLRSRIADVNPLAQRVTAQMRGSMSRDGDVIAEDETTLVMTLYFTYELEAMIRAAGFVDVEMFGDYTDDPPMRDTNVVVYVARKPG